MVSFDPRGIGQSAVLHCFDTIAQEHQFLAGLPAGRSWQRFSTPAMTAVTIMRLRSREGALPVGQLGGWPAGSVFSVR